MHIIAKMTLTKLSEGQMYKQNKGKILDKHRIAALISCKKYSKFRSGPSKLTAYIKKIPAKVPKKSLGEKHLYIKHMVKACLIS